MGDRPLEYLAVKAYRSRLFASLEPDEDRLVVAGLASGHRVAGAELAAEGRHQVRGLPASMTWTSTRSSTRASNAASAPSKVIGVWIVVEDCLCQEDGLLPQPGGFEGPVPLARLEGRKK